MHPRLKNAVLDALSVSTSAIEHRGPGTGEETVDAYLGDLKLVLQGKGSDELVMMVATLGDLVSTLTHELAESRCETPEQLIQRVALAIQHRL